MNRQNSRTIFVYESEDIVVGQPSAQETHLPAVTLEKVRNHLGAEFLQFIGRATYHHFLVPAGPSRQFILKLIHDSAVHSRRQMLLDRTYFVRPQEPFDFHHNRPHYINVNGICRDTALQGLFYHAPASSSITPQQRFQITSQNVLLNHNVSLQYVFQFALFAYFAIQAQL
jgi:hypothetical protein